MGVILTLVEHSDGQLRAASLSAVAAAREAAAASGDAVLLLVLGGDDAPAAAQAASAYGDGLVASDASLAAATAEAWAPVIAGLAKERGARVVMGTATSVGKDVLPRAAALLDAGMASDISAVVALDGSVLRVKRPMWAGNVVGVTEISGAIAVASVRATEFDAAPAAANAGAVTAAAATAGPQATSIVGFQSAGGGSRPDPTEARVVCAGGRGFKNGENFSLLEQLCDSLGAGIGASRAACDAGWVPNDWQIGQTGKVVAPDLYFAVGISGAIQHLAGMKGSKVIVAINTNPEAPIFEVADYGLVQDLFKAIPEFVGKIG